MVLQHLLCGLHCLFHIHFEINEIYFNWGQMLKFAYACVWVCVCIYTYLSSESHKIWVMFLIKLLQRSHVFGIADEPVNRWEMLPLSQLFVQTPEHLNYTQSGWGDRISKVSTWWWYTETHNNITSSFSAVDISFLSVLFLGK